MHCKNVRIFYGKITGNRLPVHFPLFFTGAQETFSGVRHRTVAKDIIVFFFFVIQPYNPTEVFSSTVG